MVKSSYLLLSSSGTFEIRKNLDAFSVHFFAFSRHSQARGLAWTLTSHTYTISLALSREDRRERERDRKERLRVSSLCSSRATPREIVFFAFTFFSRGADNFKQRPIIRLYGKKEGYFQKHATPPTAFLDAVVHAGEFETASVLERRRRCHHDHHHHHRDRFKASGLVFSDD